MKRFFGAVGVLLLAIGLFPVSAVSAASTNNFRITSYNIQYELSRDSESRSVLRTIETITADFSQADQNHGLERALPNTYNGHSTSLEINSVTDKDGNSLSYSTNTNGDTTLLRIGDADTYVHGLNTYVISYAQRDVTRYYENTGVDEWYWDTNGTQWRVPIDALSIKVTMDAALSSVLATSPKCYQGYANDTNRCALTQEGTEFTVNASSLSAGENITVAFGFPKGTFAQYSMSPFEILAGIWMVLQFISLPLVFGLIILFSILVARKSYRMAEEKPIAAEYIPPKDASVIVATQVFASAQAAFTAQLIDLAVRHYISIVQTKEASIWKVAEYDLVIASDLTELREEEKELLSDMFNGLPSVGDRLALKTLQNNMAYHARTLDNDKKLKVLLDTTYGLRAKSKTASRFFYRWAIIFLVFGIVLVMPAFGFLALIVWVFGLAVRPLTDKGLSLRRYILGLNRYIKASEVERLKFLQGPDTAQKIGYNVDPNNPGEMVKLYERVLPYAILFGYEKEWSKRLGEFYTQTQTAPGWYSGTTAFNAAVFASTMSSFSSATTAYGGSSASSSSGGSSGGGSSGGGGGGGGGGGW